MDIVIHYRGGGGILSNLKPGKNYKKDLIKKERKRKRGCRKKTGARLVKGENYLKFVSLFTNIYH